MSVIKEIIDNELINRIVFDDTNQTVCIEFNGDINQNEIENRFGNGYSVGRSSSGNWAIVIYTANLGEGELESLRSYSSTHRPVGNFQENREGINRDTLPKAFR